MELKYRKLIKNGGLPGFNGGLLPDGIINFTNPDQFDFNNPTGDVKIMGLARDVKPVSISAMTDDIIQNRVNELKEVPLKKSRPSKVSSGSSINVDAIGGAIQTGTQFAKSLHDSFKTNASVNQYLADAGTSEQSVGGISYRTINSIYKDGKLPKFADGLNDTLGTAASGAAFGASVGSIIPGIGTGIGALAGGVIGGIGGFFGSKHKQEQERKMKEEANRIRLNTNNFNFSGALSQYLQQKEQENLSEPAYAGGKLPSYENGTPWLDTSFGMMKGVPNARVDKGEWMINTITGAAHKVRRGAGDNALAHVEPEDAILSKKRGAADYFEQTGDLQGALYMNKQRYCNGKLPRLAEGWIPNAIIGGLGALTGLSQYIGAKNQKVKSPNTYASNPYQSRALAGLAGLQYNPYPILRQLNNTRARYDYALNNSGGLSGAQKYLGKIANANDMYSAYANALAGLQERNIGLRSNYYNTMLNAGQNEAQRRMQANQYDLDYYSKAHAARQSGMQMGMYNMLNQMQNWYANDFKRRQFNDTMSLYGDNQKLEREKLKKGIV